MSISPAYYAGIDVSISPNVIRDFFEKDSD